MQSARRAGVAGLAGWAADDHAAALAAYRRTEDLLSPDWPRYAGEDPRAFFERRFRLAGPRPVLLTGYYEPEVDAAEAEDAAFRHPVYAAPPDLPAEEPWLTRAEIEDGARLAGRELIWLASAIEAFLAQVQGSFRVRLPDGRIRRFGFAARNGHPYRSIGAELIARGAIPAAAMSAQAIRVWCDRHPDEVSGLLRSNPSFVFFRPLDLPDESGPPGAMGRPVTAMRSLAVDPSVVPLGAPVWTCTNGEGRLTVAQDTGSAITGPGRADLFCGSGDAAGESAGRMRLDAVLTPLLPRAAQRGAT